MNEIQTRSNMTSEASGDGPVNGISTQVDDVMLVHILVYGHGAGDPGVIHMTLNRTRPRLIDAGVTITREFNQRMTIT